VSNDQRTETLKPIIKWAGGKGWITAHLRGLPVDWHNVTLVDPFCGGNSIALGLNPKRAILNDLNSHVINLYAQIKAGMTKLSLRPQNTEEQYYRYRQRFNKLIEQDNTETIQAAELFYTLMKLCYRGLARHAKGTGFFNTPYGFYSKHSMLKDFTPYRKAFSNWEFTSGDFADITPVDSQIVYFLDPPYDDAFTQYAGRPFDWNDQCRLIDWATSHSGPVIITNHATHRIKRLYRKAGFSIQILQAPRRINCNGDRTPVPEVLAVRGL